MTKVCNKVIKNETKMKIEIQYKHKNLIQNIDKNYSLQIILKTGSNPAQLV